MKIKPSLVVLIFFTTISFGQSSIETDKSLLKKLVVESLDEIWSKLNSEKIHKYYTNNFMLLEDGVVWNNDSISNYLDNEILKKPIPKRENTIQIIENKIRDGVAWIAYQHYAKFSVENKIIRKSHWLESATAILTENGWKLDMLHSTKIKNE